MPEFVKHYWVFIVIGLAGAAVFIVGVGQSQDKSNFILKDYVQQKEKAAHPSQTNPTADMPK